MENPKEVVSCGDGWYSKIDYGYVDAVAICANEGYQGKIAIAKNQEKCKAKAGSQLDNLASSSKPYHTLLANF